MKKEIEGVVIALDSKIAKVRASRHSDCENCGACPGENAMVIDAYNQVDAKVGQMVIVEIPETHMLKAAFVVYLLPLLTTFLGYLIGLWISQKYGFPALLSEVGAGAIAFVLTLLYIKYFDTSMRKTKILPVITDILSKK